VITTESILSLRLGCQVLLLLKSNMESNANLNVSMLGCLGAVFGVFFAGILDCFHLLDLVMLKGHGFKEAFGPYYVGIVR
jgi:hypothetical protein